MTPGLGVGCDDLPRLRDRAVSLLTSGPAPTPALATQLFGLTRAPTDMAARLVREVLGADPRFQAAGSRWLLRDGHDTWATTPLHKLEFVVVDVEATGGSPARGDRITEIAAIRLRGGRRLRVFESLINPERPIPAVVTGLTNITNDMVVGAPRFTDRVEELRGILEGAILVAHNVAFDWRMLRAEFLRCRGIRLRGARICTLRLARLLHPELPRRNLRTLSDYYSIDCEVWHRAGPDCRAAAEIFSRFLDRLEEEEGVRFWGDLQAYLGWAPPGSGPDA